LLKFRKRHPRLPSQNKDQANHFYPSPRDKSSLNAAASGSKPARVALRCLLVY
jgi:hypothetical protein